jgi:hypothetical protein
MEAAIVAARLAPRVPRRDTLEALLDDFPAANLALLDQRALLSRVDSKFVVPVEELEEILAGLDGAYACLRVERGPMAQYHSLYFDTPALQCFHDHRRGRRIRHKVRLRHYPDRSVSFLEVKTKRNEALTVKKRLAVPFGHDRLEDEELAFLRTHVGAIADDLRPQVAINYRRLSLLGVETDERVTIDLGLCVDGGDGDLVAQTLGHLAVIEVKQWPYCVRTPIMRALRGSGHRLLSLSKYIVAMSLMRPELCRNRMQAALRKLERI